MNMTNQPTCLSGTGKTFDECHEGTYDLKIGQCQSPEEPQPCNVVLGI